MRKIHLLFYPIYSMCVILTACNLALSDERPVPTATTVHIPPGSAIATQERDLHPVSSQEPQTTATLAGCHPADNQPTTQHSVVADINYAQHEVSVQQQIVYINRSEDTLPQIVLNVEPNRWLNAFILGTVQVNDAPASAEITGQRLTIDLPEPLMPDCIITMQLAFELHVQAVGQGQNAYHGYFGYSPRQLNLGHWLPVIATRANGEWVSHQEFSIGEQEVLDIADWDVTLRVTNAPDSLQVAAPGTMTQLAPLNWQFTLSASRDFSLSLSPAFIKSSMKTKDKLTTVELYSFDDTVVPTKTGPQDSAPYALDIATKALDIYSNLYGKYPYTRMVVVQGDFPDGMEFNGLVFVSGNWFRGYDGTPKGFLTVITVHEVAHQWWYAEVGNDQAMNPWLDEALATYSEFVFIEEIDPDLKDWWWNFRVNDYFPQGFVDSTVYDFVSLRDYINAVYLRGVSMLQEIRNTIGTEAFFALLHQYAEAGKGKVVTPDVFWGLMTPQQYEATRPIRMKYFHKPDVLERTDAP